MIGSVRSFLSKANPRFLPWGAEALCALGLILYFLFPYTPPALGISPHLFFLLPAALWTLPKLLQKPAKSETILLLLIAATVAGSFLFAPKTPDLTILRGWGFSLLLFWTCRHTLGEISLRKVDMALQFLLALYAASSFAQVYLGDIGYVSAWFGQAIGTRYAMGLASFTNQGASLMVPLLLGALFFNIQKPEKIRSLLLVAGYAAFYFTLSRAAWLGLFAGVFVLAFSYGRDKAKQIRLTLSLMTGLLIASVAWSAAGLHVARYQMGGPNANKRWETDEKMMPKDYSASTRLATLLAAQKAVSADPFTGLGLGHFPELYKIHRDEIVSLLPMKIDKHVDMTPHNAYAQFIAEMGLPAFFALMAYFGFILYKIRLSLSPFAPVLLASLTGLFFYLFFHDGFVDRLLWIQLGFGMALTNKPKESL